VKQVQRLLAFCRLPGPDATAADKRVALDANIYVMNQLIGAPRQAVDLSVDDRQTIRLVWGQAVKDVIDGESRVVDDVTPAREGEDGPEAT